MKFTVSVMNRFLPSQLTVDSLSELSDYAISYITDIDRQQDHYHCCYKIVVALDRHFSCIIDGEELTGLEGIIVNRAVPHTFGGKGDVLVMLIKTDCMYGRRMGELLSDNACLELSTVWSGFQNLKVLPVNYRELADGILLSLISKFLKMIFHHTDQREHPKADPRILLVVKYIEQNLHETLELEQVAVLINLSSERTRHLFVQQMSISFSQYVLWMRVKKTLASVVVHDKKITEACLQFGFSDQAHFNHAFKQIFGIRPTEILRQSRLLM